MKKLTIKQDYMNMLLALVGTLILAWIVTAELYFGANFKTIKRILISGFIFFSYYIYCFKSYLIGDLWKNKRLKKKRKKDWTTDDKIMLPLIAILSLIITRIVYDRWWLR